MKAKTLLAMGLCAAIGLAATPTKLAAQGHEHQEHKGGGEKVQVPDTLDGIWKEIHKHHQELGETINSKKLGEVHHHAFAIRDLAKALPAKVPAEHKKHIENLVKRVSQIAEDLDKSGDAGDQPKTEANLKKMDKVLKEMEDMVGPSQASPHQH